MSNEFQHKSVGSQMTQTEYEHTDGTGHIFDSQATGDIAYADSSTVLKRLGIGSTGQLLEVSSGKPAWTATLTGVTSVLNTSLVIGRDADNDIDFGTDNTILFRADGADQIKLTNGALLPVTDDDIDLGSSSLQFKDGHFDGTVEADAITVGGTAVLTGGAVTSITSVVNTSLVVGRDADNDIDFGTDNNIIFRAGAADQIKLIDGALAPVTDNDVDLGTSSLEFKDAFFDGTVTTDALAMATNTSGNLLIGTGSAFASTAVTDLSAISSIDNADTFLAIDDTDGALKKVARSVVVSGLATSSALSNVVEDTAPHLGGDLDVQTNSIITDASNRNIKLAPHGTGLIEVRGNTNPGSIILNCESNSHGQTIKAQAHSEGVTNTLTLPAGSSSTLVSLVSTDTLTNKTLTTPKIAEIDSLSSGNIVLDAEANIELNADGGTITFADDSASLGTITSSGYSGNAAGLSSTLTVASGGTGATSFADKSVIITQDSGTDTLAAVAMSTNGQLLIGGTSGPAVAVPTGGDGLTVTVGDGSLEYDLDAALTTVTSVYNSSLAIGYGSSHANIDFGTDNSIIFDIDGTSQIQLDDGILKPTTDVDIDLGTTTLRYKSLYAQKFAMDASVDGIGNNDYSGITALFRVGNGADVGAYDLVVFSDDVDNEVEKANASAIATGRVIGINPNNSDITDNSEGVILLHGIVRNDSWSWTRGQTLYASASTAGDITATAPSSTNNVVVPVAIAIEADMIYFNPTQTIVEHA